MVSTYTPNVQLEEPARGDYVGTWDTPVNANTTLIDLILGGRTTISGAAGSVVLAAAQYQCKTITFNSTLLASITVTFPTSFTKSYEIYNTCTGSSAYTITLQTTVAGGQVICAPPGEIIEMVNDGTNIRFKNLGRIGSYMDISVTVVPNWISGCTVPPYLNCDASTFSSATYPVLTTILGGTTLPDTRGRTRFNIDQGAGRLSSAVIGFSPNTIGAGGGDPTTTLGTSNLPAYTPSGTVAQAGVGYSQRSDFQTGGASFGLQTIQASGGTGSITLNSQAFTGSPQGGVADPISIMPPTYIGGLTMIRAG
jgi:hypothetical protein